MTEYSKLEKRVLERAKTSRGRFNRWLTWFNLFLPLIFLMVTVPLWVRTVQNCRFTLAVPISIKGVGEELVPLNEISLLWIIMEVLIALAILMGVAVWFAFRLNRERQVLSGVIEKLEEKNKGT